MRITWESNHTLLHATWTSRVETIMKMGLIPASPSDPVHLSTDDETDLIIFLMSDGVCSWCDSCVAKGPCTETVTLLEVEVSGLELHHPGPDGAHHYMCYGMIPPDRIRVVKTCTREYIDNGTFSRKLGVKD